MVYALSDEFRALSGFRPVAETRAVLDAAAPGLLPALKTDADIRPVFEWLLSGGPEVAATVAEISDLAQTAEGDSWRTVRGLVAAYPGDPGIAVSLLLHTVVLRRGEALYLPAGNIHAYQEGLGIELMGPSDNVLRGGLTPKHVDVPELLSVLDFRPLPAPLLPGTVDGGVTTFAPPGAGWRLQVASDAAMPVTGRGILLVVSGAVRGLGPGEAAYVADETVEVPVGAVAALASTV